LTRRIPKVRICLSLLAIPPGLWQAGLLATGRGTIGSGLIEKTSPKGSRISEKEESVICPRFCYRRGAASNILRTDGYNGSTNNY
jgi:hypothetical protein